MIFDAHSDIWTHVARMRLKGEDNIIRNYHLDKDLEWTGRFELRG